MEVRITELLNGLELDALPLEDSPVVSATKIKELTTMKLQQTEKKTRRRAGKRILALALAAAMILALGITAYAGGWFGLNEATIGGQTLADSFSDGEYRGKAVVPAKVISLAGYAGTAEFQASREWREFYNDYVSHKYYGDTFGQDLGEWGSARHVAYDELYTPALCEKFKEISEKYGLLTRTGKYSAPSLNNYRDLCEIAGISPFLDSDGRSLSWGGVGDYSVYDDGSFACGDCWWPEGKPGETDAMIYDIRIYRNVKGSMDTGFVEFGADEVLDEWEYTTAKGDTVDLVLGESKALILCEGEGAYVTVIWGQLQIVREKELEIDRGTLERYADTVDFGSLSSVGTVDWRGSGDAYSIPTPEPEG